MIWITSDEHYGHTNIIKYCKRPFKHIDDMNDQLIERHNKLVDRDDIVYHLGDFCRYKPDNILRRLNGRHHLVLGNHDDRKEVRAAGFISVHDVFWLKAYECEFFLSHYAHRIWNKAHHGSYHLYGHSHGGLPGQGRSMDVGVDVERRYAPWSLPEIIKKLEKQPYGHHHGD